MRLRVQANYVTRAINNPAAIPSISDFFKRAASGLVGTKAGGVLSPAGLSTTQNVAAFGAARKKISAWCGRG